MLPVIAGQVASDKDACDTPQYSKQEHLVERQAVDVGLQILLGGPSEPDLAGDQPADEERGRSDQRKPPSRSAPPREDLGQESESEAHRNQHTNAGKPKIPRHGTSLPPRLRSAAVPTTASPVWAVTRNARRNTIARPGIGHRPEPKVLTALGAGQRCWSAACCTRSTWRAHQSASPMSSRSLPPRPSIVSRMMSACPACCAVSATIRTSNDPRVVDRRSSGHHATDAGASSPSSAMDWSECCHAVRYSAIRSSRVS